MMDLYKKFTDKDLSEEEMIKSLKGEIDDIEGLGNSIVTLLKHCRFQFILCLILFFTMDKYIWSIMTASIWLITFLIASYKYSVRQNKIMMYWYMINYFKEAGKINENNEDELKNYGYTILPFERK